MFNESNRLEAMLKREEREGLNIAALTSYEKF